MTVTPEMLSAYLDCELAPLDAMRVEAALERDPELAGQLARLQAVDALAWAEFEDDMHDPIPVELVQAIQSAKMAGPANLGWR
ncbi:MAG: anti-sigma factor family protein, partial [Primorskyibacter sp.]